MIYLSTTAIVPDRIFTHPQHTIYDRRVLSYMLVRLCQLNDRLTQSDSQQPINYIDPQPDGRTHRIVLVRPRWLAASTTEPLVVVGFFGQRQVGMATIDLQSRDDLLVEMFPQQEGLLSYSTIELTCGNYANCVLFASEEAKNSWGANPLHRELAHEMSPRFYYSVRLYNGLLPAGIHQPERLDLIKVKYFDYSSQPLWRAERTLVA